MSDNSSEEEPSIEEILASIRQIISDDDEEENEQEDPEEDVLESPIREGTNDVLELTEADLEEQEAKSKPAPYVDDQPDIDMRDIDEPEVFASEPEPEPGPEPVYEPPEPSYEPEPRGAATLPSDIMSSGVQAAAMGSLSKLSKRMPINNSRSYDGVTLEDIVRELLHPMLREWMDDNLPPMVERIVQKEIEKMARRATED